MSSSPFAGKLQALGYSSYDSYLASSHWRDMRKRYREAADRPQNCINCGSEHFELHHTTYERLGAEELDDIAPLCRDCHQLVHVLERRGDSDLAMSGLASAERAALYAVDTRRRDARRASEWIDSRDPRRELRGLAQHLKRAPIACGPQEAAEAISMIRAALDILKGADAEKAA